MAAVTSGLLTIVKMGINIVSYFSNVIAFLFTLNYSQLENSHLGDP